MLPVSGKADTKKILSVSFCNSFQNKIEESASSAVRTLEALAGHPSECESIQETPII